MYQHLPFIFLLLKLCLLSFHSPLELPDDQGAVSPHEDLFFPSSRNDDPYYGPDLPVSAIAGLEGDEAETFVVVTEFFSFLLFQVIILSIQISVNKFIILMFVK